MDISQIERLANTFSEKLVATKKQIAPQDFGWYPYGTLGNFALLNHMLTGQNRSFLDNVGDQPIVDIGAADGDTAFFLESLGYRTHVADYPPTNYNGCRGVRALKTAFGSDVTIQEADLDRTFELPGERYELAFFLGILYHLKNPYAALESLAKHARYAFISTRVTRFNVAVGAEPGSEFNDRRVDMRSVPVAYLVDEIECNNDPTNFWMFTNAGLQRILRRTGWEILDYANFGNLTNSDPATGAGDERAFCYVRSRHL